MDWILSGQLDVNKKLFTDLPGFVQECAVKAGTFTLGREPNLSFPAKRKRNNLPGTNTTTKAFI